MFRLWAKEWKDGRIVRHMTVGDDTRDTRTHKVFHALTKVCYEFDLPEPIWLDKNVRHFQQQGKCRFGRDNYVEDIPFDYLEIEIVEEDDGA